MNVQSSKDILSALVSFDTVSRNSNLDLIAWIEGYLDKLGVKHERVYDETGKKSNLWATLGRNWWSPALLAALAAPTTAIAIVSGQTGFLAAALLAGGLRLAAPNPVAGGVLLGLLTYKPQLGLLVPV